MFGIVDSGADSTSLPFGYALLMGYTDDTLTPEEFGQASGTNGIGFKATVPCTAVVPEIPDVTIEMLPLFVQGSQYPLWGRLDFMAKFDLTIQENQQQFSITPV